MDNSGQFKARNWLSCLPHSSSQDDLCGLLKEHSKKAISDFSEFFSPANFCVAGWSGEGLLTPGALNIYNLLEELSLEALHLLQSREALTQSLKRSIFEEFVSYCSSEDIHIPELDSSEVFWEHALNDSPFKQTLCGFLKNYAFRTVTVYIFKIRFITQLCRATKKNYEKHNLLNPHSFLDKIFKKGSSTELHCEALRPNQYSWYRPSQLFQDKIFSLAQNFNQISITQMMKICTYSAPEHEGQKQRAIFDDKEYSHALSHRSFGLLINELLLFFPYWQNSESYPLNHQEGKLPSIVNVKFSGKKLSALTLSHWLAQEYNLESRTDEWTELLCPSFLGTTFHNGAFVRFCHELQFLTFLCDVSEKQSHDPIKLIANVMRAKYDNSESSPFEHQTSMLTKEQAIYQRIFLNLSDLPPHNPHNALTFKISSEAKNLSHDGYLFVMSNQKLFVPSKEDKTQQLLDHLKLESLFSFENLKGRGEIPSFLYIFTKKRRNSPQNLPGFMPGTKKEHCLSFRIDGELGTFSKLHDLVSNLSTFFANKKTLHMPVYQTNIGESLNLQFHQDFIIDGRMINSDTEDPHCITHPSFLRNLAQACLPFDKFFRVETIKESARDIEKNLLGLNHDVGPNFPLLLIVNKSNSENVTLEISSFETYPAKLEKYGAAYYSYFGLVPKFVDINLNLFREYFKSRIGHQVLQFSLGGTLSNLRSRIKGLLIPAFFSLNSVPQERSLAEIHLFTLKKEELLRKDPNSLVMLFKQQLEALEKLSEIYPWYTLGQIVEFHHELEMALETIQLQKSSVRFENPMVSSELIKLKTLPIYPTEHPDVFVELIETSVQKLKTNTCWEILKKNETLEIRSEQHALIRFHAPQSLLKFLDYILSQAKGVALSNILTHLQLPYAKDLESVLGNFQTTLAHFEEMTKACSQFIELGISKEISRNKNF